MVPYRINSVREPRRAYIPCLSITSMFTAGKYGRLNICPQGKYKIDAVIKVMVGVVRRFSPILKNGVIK
jgi:hypothetical protein